MLNRANNLPVLTGVIGDPIGHSRSPLIHNHWLRQHQINGIYVPIEVNRQNFRDVYYALPKMGFRGMNITIPHKEAALQVCDSLSDEAALIGAVNTLTVNDEKKVFGNNTDAYGFLQNLSEGAGDWKADGGPILVLGAGGAARGVIYALISKGASEVHIANRTLERANLLSSEFGKRVIPHSLSSITGLVPNMCTIINSTSLGMEGRPPLAFPYQALKPGTVINDLVYTPLQTTFLAEAKMRECITVDGIGMLLHQAAASFDYWFGVRPKVDQALRQAVVSS